MRAEHVNAFLVPSVQVIKKMVGTDVSVGKITRLGESKVKDNLSIIIGLHGRLKGSVVLSAPRDVAWALASQIAGEDYGESDYGEVRAIIAELANTIVGNATGHLYSIGVKEGISPPTVVMGPNVCFNFDEGVETVLIPLETGAGAVDLVVSLVKEDPF